MRDVVFVGGSVALQLVPVRFVFEVEGLPPHAVARPVLGIDAAIEDLEDVVLANTLVVMFVVLLTSNARLKHCRYWMWM